MKIIIVLVFTFLSCTTFAQDPQIEWQNTIGGNDLDALLPIQQTSDGGYICGGTSSSDISGDKTENSQGGSDYWIVKLDSTGNIQWQNTIGGNNAEYLFAIQQTSDEGFICGGKSWSNISGDKTENNWGQGDYWIVKLDSIGNIQWQNTIGGNNDEQLYSVLQTYDGGYICGGYSQSNISGDKIENTVGWADYWIIKLDSSGNIQWQNTIGGNGNDQLHSIQLTDDGGFIVGGISDSDISGDKTENSQGAFDYWVVKLDSLGNIQWQKTIGGSYSDALRSVNVTNDGGYICGGESDSNISGDKTENSQGSYDYWVVKLDSTGAIQWQNTIGGDSLDYATSVQQTTDGGIICGGFSLSSASGDKTENSQGLEDYWVVKLDSTGAIQWQNTIGGNDFDYLHSIQQTTDEGFICGGHSRSNVSGDKTENSHGNLDFWVVKLFPDSINILYLNELTYFSKLSVYPNPTNNELTISAKYLDFKNNIITMYNALGQLVLHEKVNNPNATKHTLDVSTLAKGVYQLVVTEGGKFYSAKILIE